MNSNSCYIIGAYSTVFRKYRERSFKDLTREAFLGILADADMEAGDQIDSVYFGNCSMHHWNQGCIRGNTCFIPLVRDGLIRERIPMFTMEGACATGSMVFQAAWKEILSGQSHLTLAIGVEKMFMPSDPEKMFQVFRDGFDQLDFAETVETYQAAAEITGDKFEPGPGHTLAMDAYATLARYHMWRYGTTQRQMAISAQKNHAFGARNPKAQYQFELSLDQILEDKVVAHPLTRSMCSPISDGAAAALICSEEYLNNLPSKMRNRAVKIRACAFSSGKYRSIEEPGPSMAVAEKAYRAAGIGPGDIDVAEVHDAVSFCELYQAEMLGFCPIGEGGPFIESGATMLDGKIPINTSGGLVSKGHPLGATGLSMIFELTTQLRGEAGERQVKNAEFALQENGGGFIGFDEANCSVIILQKDR